MPEYTKRRTNFSVDHPDWDFVFLVDGKDAGRCYYTERPGLHWVWHWTIYGRPLTGDEPTLEAAQEAFKRAYEG
jgi:hypothetical protein